ncbi:MAG: c-type cytochrome [Magnetospirillum sp.]|nr:c-type cytochrome [Magnetospirillum sp.]
MSFKKLAVVAVAAALLAPAAAKAADPEGWNNCKACHLLTGKNGVGPNLQGVAGRKAGAVEGFKYSPAMSGSGLTWDEATLTKYLTDPKGTIPGNKMAFNGFGKMADQDKAKRELASLLAFLKTYK